MARPVYGVKEAVLAILPEASAVYSSVFYSKEKPQLFEKQELRRENK